MSGGDDGGIKTPAKYREMIPLVPALPVAGSGTAGVFTGGRTLTLYPYRIAKYETTWELWNEVYGWALNHGYRIANRGSGEKQTQPVTDISWRDAVVWCNAYSEMRGLEPVYYGSGDSVLRESVNNTPEAPARIDTEADRALMRRDKNGYRLPLEIEWEYAARGGSPESADWSLAYAGSNSPDDIAWYEANSGGGAVPGARPVGTMTGGAYSGANRLGLYDMSGNAAEWCWDWNNENGVTPATPTEGDGPGNFAHRITRGGSWRNEAASCVVTDRNYCRPFSRGSYLGFRVAQMGSTAAESGNRALTSLVGTCWWWPSLQLFFISNDRVMLYSTGSYYPYAGYPFQYTSPAPGYAYSYTYDSSQKKGRISSLGEYSGGDLGDFTITADNQSLDFTNYKSYGHGADFETLRPARDKGYVFGAVPANMGGTIWMGTAPGTSLGGFTGNPVIIQFNDNGTAYITRTYDVDTEAKKKRLYTLTRSGDTGNIEDIGSFTIDPAGTITVANFDGSPITFSRIY
jgi:formylglycine-generating enzyme required for sulfatase activity